MTCQSHEASKLGRKDSGSHHLVPELPIVEEPCLSRVFEGRGRPSGSWAALGTPLFHLLSWSLALWPGKKQISLSKNFPLFAQGHLLCFFSPEGLESNNLGLEL